MYDFPDFIIAGSAKSGTTALYYMLDQHPDIYMSTVKETNFFVHGFEQTQHYVDHRGRPVLSPEQRRAVVDSVEKYRAAFHGASERQKLGEASPWYLINRRTPARIRRHRAATRIVLILRNPTDVAFANFMHHVRAGSESLSLAEIERALDDRRYQRDDLYPFCRHLEIAHYGTHLPVWLDTFPRSQLHLMIYEEFRARRRAALSELFDFLGVSDAVPIDVEQRVNVSGLPRSVTVRDLIQGSSAVKKLIAAVVPAKPRRRARALLESLNTNPRIEMPSAVRAQLDGLYAADAAYVEQLLGRRVDDWRMRRTRTASPEHGAPSRDPLAHAACRGVRRTVE